ncbi:ATP-binding protein [Planctomicrobium sp. SH661]|uniref:ATP-binding protein n=1 Tax=Planctomicrobium sp. SH661 TaxID=3448124 RepID=UPI003F5B8431
MDTLGTITPQVARPTESEHRTEALERLRYLAHTGASGLVSGASGTGKSWCLSELAGQLRREGISVAQVNLAGVSSTEFPWLISSRLGSGLSSCTDSVDCWLWLREYAESSRSSHRKLAFLIDHVERSEDAVIAPLSRLLDSFGNSCSWIFAAGRPLTDAWQTFFHEQIWLRVELQDLAQRESMQLLSRELRERGSHARFTPEGIQAAQEVAHGRIRRLRQLAELASLASEAEGVVQIDADMVHALAAELV